MNNIKEKVLKEVIKKFGFQEDYTFDDWTKETDFALDLTLAEVGKVIDNIFSIGNFKKFSQSKGADPKAWAFDYQLFVKRRLKQKLGIK